MKVKSFHPVIATCHAEDTIAFFESIGFKIAHVRMADDGSSPNNTLLKDEEGHVVEVTCIGDRFGKTEDTMMIHINVEDIDEDCKFMESKGFKQVLQDEYECAKYRTFEAPSGYIIDLCKHIRKK